MNALHQQVVSLEGEIADLHALLLHLAGGVEDRDTSRSIMAVSRVVLRISNRADAIAAQMLPEVVG